MGAEMLLVAEIEECTDILVGDEDNIAAAAARTAIGTADPVDLVPIKTVAAFGAIAGLDVYLGFVYKHVISLRVRCASA